MQSPPPSVTTAPSSHQTVQNASTSPPVTHPPSSLPLHPSPPRPVVPASSISQPSEPPEQSVRAEPRLSSSDDDDDMAPAFVSSLSPPILLQPHRNAQRHRHNATPRASAAVPDHPAGRHNVAAAAKRPAPPAYAPPALSELVLSSPKPGIDFHGIPNPPPGAQLKLADLRERLIRQEETIIFAIIERAQFRHNDVIYVPNAFDLPAYPHLSFSQYMLYELEKVSATVGRYGSPDEHPFSPRDALPPSVLPTLEYPPTLVPNAVNINPTIERVYRESLLPAVCEPGDDQNYGSAATCDASCLQALSKRIHYGKFIAESKCQGDEETYGRLAAACNRPAIWELLSNRAVERNLLKRVENKARNYGSDITDEGAREVYKVEPTLIAELYRDFIIPLTKEVEVDYIIERYERKSQ